MQSVIREPALEWATGQAMSVTLNPLTLPSGRNVSDFSAWTLTVREDPEWPRSGASAARRTAADPIADGWPIAATCAGTVESSVPTFNFTMPTGAGVMRYAVDVWGTLTAGGEVQLYEATWLTALARVK